MKNFTSFMVKADRYAAWTLLTVVILYALTGYGMTKGLVGRELTTSLHLGWLGAVGLAAFVIHAGWAIHLAFRRWQIWNVFSQIFLFIFFLLLASFFIYLEFFYKLKTNSPGNYISPADNQSIQLEQSEQIFTVETLSAFDGLNGQPSYIAVDGLVYDVTSLFRNGTHYGCQAGQDVSVEFNDYHYESLLDGFEVVGKYQTN